MLSAAVKIGDLNVGGEAEVGGGSITGNIRVGGKFISKTPLEFGELLVYGKGSLPAGCKGRRISTFGKLDVDGNITCDYIEAGGVIEIHGDCHAQNVLRLAENLRLLAHSLFPIDLKAME